jgi:UDP-GlcNAc:undecaprenyl-phosphate GlcNAc-1-phosphate transferase
MSPLLIYALTFITSLALALLGTPVVCKAAIRLGIVDQPNAVRFHISPTPLLGGLAIFVAALAGMSLANPLHDYPLGAFIGASMILLLGIVDDLYHIKPLLKLLGQIAAAAVLVLFGLIVETTGSPIFDTAITIFWVVGLTNAFNLLDNMDGLSSGIAAIAAFCFFVIGAQAGQTITAGAALALCGACLGFLHYNFASRPARIFMGDTGSMLIGYLLAAIAVRLTYDSQPWITPFVPIAILGIPILDTTFVSFARPLGGRSPFQGGKDHLSHRLVAACALSPRKAVSLLWLAGIGLGLAGIAIVFRQIWIAIAAAALLSIFTTLFVILLLKKKSCSSADSDQKASLAEAPTAAKAWAAKGLIKLESAPGMDVKANDEI